MKAFARMIYVNDLCLVSPETQFATLERFIGLGRNKHSSVRISVHKRKPAALAPAPDSKRNPAQNLTAAIKRYFSPEFD